MKKIKMENADRLYSDKRTRFVYLLLRAIIIIIMVIHGFEHDYESVFL